MLLAARSPISRLSRYFDEALEVRFRAKSTLKSASKRFDFFYFEIFVCKGFGKHYVFLTRYFPYQKSKFSIAHSPK